MAKKLVVYYSRTGNTKKLAEEFARVMKADIEELVDIKDRKGVLGFLKSGYEAGRRKTTELKNKKLNLSKYDLVLVGTPVWNWNLCPPVRTFLRSNKIKNNTVFFCTMGGSGSDKTFSEMVKESGKEPVCTLALREKQVKDGSYKEIVREFTETL